MKEFMLLIHNKGDHQATWSPGRHLEFLNKCEVYINNLKKENKLVAAQPLVREGRVIVGSAGAWKEESFDASGDVQVGYYHIRAKDIDEAIAIVKGNPEFEYGATARVEVRPIKTKEGVTGFVYPKKSGRF